MSGVPNIKQQLKRARAAGLKVDPLPSSGEVFVSVPGEPRLRLNARRKTGSSVLQRLIERREEDRGETST